MDVDALSRASSAATSIAKAADVTGVDFSYLMNAAMRESAFNPAAKNARSTASGMFQFIEQTWLAMVKRHGEKHGLSDLARSVQSDSQGRYFVNNAADRRTILGLRFDADTSAKLAGELTAENAGYLKQALGRAATNGELYAAHVLGAKGAAQLAEVATSQPLTRAATLFPAAAKANHSLFFAKDGRAFTASEVLQGFTSMLNRANDVVAPTNDGLMLAKADRGQAQDADQSARATFMAALMELQAAPIGFAKGGFGADEGIDTAASKMLMQAFNGLG